MDNNSINNQDISRISEFKKFYNNISGIKKDDWSKNGGYFWHYRHSREYTPETIQSILNGDDVYNKRLLSQYFFKTNGIYQRILILYATLLNYYGILIPQTLNIKKLKEKKLINKYNKALEFISNSSLPDLCTNWALKVLTNGNYYGLLTTNKNKITVIDLPPNFCESNYIDINGNEIIEFKVSYFDKITNPDIKNSVLNTYPPFIKKAYKKYEKHGGTYEKVMIPSNLGISFSLFDGNPLFLNIIPSILQYNDTVTLEQERDLEEIKKIIVQKIPHINTTGELVFEPEEAQLMHDGTVDMMRNNKNVSILTTYADVDSIVSKTSNDTNSNNLEKMLNNVYTSTGVSNQLFAYAGSSALKNSLDKDLSLMMILAHKFGNCISNILNNEFGDSNFNFKYEFLPIAEYNKQDYLDSSLKLANSGYSFLLPSIALGIDQKDIVTLKTLDNDILKLTEILIPLSTSYTQSSEDSAGRPTLKEEKKSAKTIENEESINNQGGIKDGKQSE